jgi:TolB protein
VLVGCASKSLPGIPRLWLFPVSGGRVTALTAQRTGRGQDLGDIAAWKLTSGVYLQALGACGVQFIATQSRNGSAHQVAIPGVHYASDMIVTGHGASLLVNANNGCSAGAALVWFNPHTKKVTWVIRGLKSGIGLESVVPFGRPVS